MTHEPALRLRRGQPRILGNLMAIAICVIWAITFVAWGLMPGPVKPDVGVNIPPETCTTTTALSDNC